MDQDKRKLLIKEIEHWRRSKLLPEHYCDFLLNLYMEDPEDRNFNHTATSAIRNSNGRWWLLYFAGFTLISLVVINFNSFPFPMQIALFLLVILGCYIGGMAVHDRWKVRSYLLVGTGSALLLIAGPYLLRLHQIGEPAWIWAYVGFCCLVWVVVGLISAFAWIHLCGWLGLLLIYGFVLYSQVDSSGWPSAQLYWLPLCLLFCWTGWLLQQKFKSAGIVLLAVGSLLWFAPEIYAVSTSSMPIEVMEGSLIGKLIIAGVTLFVSRKKWTEWVG